MNIGYTKEDGDYLVKEVLKAKDLNSSFMEVAQANKNDESIISFFVSYEKEGETVKMAVLRRQDVQD
jgi:hypothetical protein